MQLCCSTALLAHGDIRSGRVPVVSRRPSSEGRVQAAAIVISCNFVAHHETVVRWG